jgi:hypothetical protein
MYTPPPIASVIKKRISEIDDKKPTGRDTGALPEFVSATIGFFGINVVVN